MTPSPMPTQPSAESLLQAIDDVCAVGISVASPSILATMIKRRARELDAAKPPSIAGTSAEDAGRLGFYVQCIDYKRTPFCNCGNRLICLRCCPASVQAALDSWFDIEDGLHGGQESEERRRMAAALAAAQSRAQGGVP